MIAIVDTTCQVAEAPDGRTLTFAEWGDPGGTPVFALHGTPGCRLDRHPNNELIRSTGARLITYDRAGYGRSDRHRGRTVADDVGDDRSFFVKIFLSSFQELRSEYRKQLVKALRIVLDAVESKKDLIFR